MLDLLVLDTVIWPLGIAGVLHSDSLQPPQAKGLWHELLLSAEFLVTAGPVHADSACKQGDAEAVRGLPDRQVQAA